MSAAGTKSPAQKASPGKLPACSARQILLCTQGVVGSSPIVSTRLTRSFGPRTTWERRSEGLHPTLMAVRWRPVPKRLPPTARSPSAWHGPAGPSCPRRAAQWRSSTARSDRLRAVNGGTSKASSSWPTPPLWAVGTRVGDVPLRAPFHLGMLGPLRPRFPIPNAVTDPLLGHWYLVRTIQCAHDQKPRAGNQETEINDDCYCTNI